MPKDGRDLEDFMPLLEREIARKEMCSRWRRMLWTKTKKQKKTKKSTIKCVIKAEAGLVGVVC